MSASLLTMVEAKSNLAIGGLRLALAASTTPRAPSGAQKAAEQLRLSLLANIRQLVRIDVSAVQMPEFLTGLLGYYQEISGLLERLLQIEDPRQRQRIRTLVGTRQAIESVLEALEDKIEDLEIATNPEVHAAIEQLIDEAKKP